MPTITPLKLVFKPVLVTIEVNIFHANGQPYIIPEDAGDDLMKLECIDNYGNGFGANPAELYVAFKHPREVTPANLIAIQNMVTEIMERHERLEALKKGEATAGDERDNLPGYTGE